MNTKEAIAQGIMGLCSERTSPSMRLRIFLWYVNRI